MPDTGSQQQKPNPLADQFADLESYVANLENFVSEPLCIINPNGVITEANSAFADLLAGNGDGIVSTSFSNLFVQQQKAQDLLADVAGENEEQSLELRLSTDQGEELMLVRAQAWKDSQNQLRGWLASVSPAEQTKADSAGKPPPAPDQPEKQDQAELLEHVKEQQIRAQSIIYNIADGVLFLDSEYVVEMANPSAMELLQVEAKKLVGEQITKLETNEILNELGNLLVRDRKLQNEELSVGTEMYFEVTTIDIGTEETDQQTIVILHDVSEKREIEKMKLEFASVAAHQMRTPLSSIRWSFEILTNKLESDELLEAARRGYRSTQQVLEVVDELLNVGRLAQGDSGYEFEQVDIVEFLSECIEEQRETRKVIEQPDIVYHEPTDHIPKVRGDGTKLKVVFRNLIENALKYTDSDSKIEIHVNIKMTSGYGGDAVVVTVEDHGIGIPEAEQDKVFSKFYRADNATDKETEGTGVGLYITKQIVEAHNGEIWFESEKGEGTKFFVQLPMASGN